MGCDEQLRRQLSPAQVAARELSIIEQKLAKRCLLAARQRFTHDGGVCPCPDWVPIALFPFLGRRLVDPSQMEKCGRVGGAQFVEKESLRDAIHVERAITASSEERRVGREWESRMSWRQSPCQ